MYAADQRLHLFFVRHRAPWWRPDAALVHLLVGCPNHVNTAIGSTVYIVQPGRGNCLQLPLDAYLANVHIGVAHLSAEVMDPARAITAAELFAVGPMTRRRSVLRGIFGFASIHDIDCVSAAVLVTNAAGHWCPCPRTPKGLLAWLSSHPQFTSRLQPSPPSSLWARLKRTRPSS